MVPDIVNYTTQSGRSGGRWKTKKVKNMYVKDSLKAKLDVSKALSCSIYTFKLTDDSANSSPFFGCLYRGLWRLLSYMPKYLRSCDVIDLCVLCLIG